MKSINILLICWKNDQTLDDPIYPEVRKYYLELLLRLSNAEQELLLLLMTLLLTSCTMKDGTRTTFADILMIGMMTCG
jgi:hypothetical protein